MSASEPESCLQIYGERRMAITIAASAAVSIEDANRDIMWTLDEVFSSLVRTYTWPLNEVFHEFSGHGIISPEEKNAAVKQTYSFLAPLRNEQPYEAGR